MSEKDSKKKDEWRNIDFTCWIFFREKKACKQLHWISELYTQLLLGQNPSLLSQGPLWLQQQSLHTYLVFKKDGNKLNENEWIKKWFLMKSRLTTKEIWGKNETENIVFKRFERIFLFRLKESEDSWTSASCSSFRVSLLLYCSFKLSLQSN